MTTLQAVILSGGSGTRLWPLSREQHPKQLLALAGQASMLQATVTRAESGAGFALAPGAIVVCNEEYRFITAEQLRQAGQTQAQIILEPIGRNTAPALTLAALLAQRAGADPVLLVMPADHVIQDSAAFNRALAAGMQQAAGEVIVTFGITPDYPETGYGYIHTGAVRAGGFAIDRFVEKPDLATAQAYLDSGEYLWNSGLFMLRASVWLKAIGHFEPGVLESCQAAVAGGQQDNDFFRVDKTAFAACPSISIDYAAMEKIAAGNLPGLGIDGCVIPLSAGWSDVGSWESLWNISPKDADGNVARGDVFLEQTRGSLVFAQDRLVACLGVDDLVVVETADAVMVARKSSAQDVKKIAAWLKAAGRSEADIHRKVHRPWGSYDTIEEGERFQVKRIVVNPGASLSLQMHYHRAEHWIVVRGTARVTCGEETFLLAENQSTYIPLGTRHRLENPGRFPLEMIEVQSGGYLGEDDIVRFEDNYQRL